MAKQKFIDCTYKSMDRWVEEWCCSMINAGLIQGDDIQVIGRVLELLKIDKLAGEGLS